MREAVRELYAESLAAGAIITSECLLAQLSTRLLIRQIPSFHARFFLESGGLDYLGLRAQPYDGRRVTQALCSAAECVINCHDNPGFDRWVHRADSGDFETSIAELMGQGLLRDAGHPTVARRETGVPRQDYDFDVEWNGRIFACEVESKQSNVVLGENTIDSSIRHAVRQLPETSPGLILLKVPTPWLMQADARTLFAKVARKFLLTKPQICSITVFWQTLDSETGPARMGFGLQEFFRDDEPEVFTRLTSGPVAILGGEGSHWISLADLVAEIQSDLTSSTADS